MAKSIRATIELASEQDVKSICEIDAREITSKPDRYISGNLLGYYVLINTWLLIIQQYSRWGWRYVRESMLKRGLFPVIKEFSDSASEFLRHVDVSSGLVKSIYLDIKDTPPIYGVPHFNNRNAHYVPDAAFLLVCRYPKRFSPVFADKLQSESIGDFISRQYKMRNEQRIELPQWLISIVREEFHNLLDWNKVVEAWDNVSIKDIIFTPGVSFDTGAPLVSKLSRLVERGVEYFPTPFGIPMIGHRSCDPVPRWGVNHQYESHIVRLIAVPKNFKTARVIAPEDVLRQAYARKYFNISDRFNPEEINLHDQTQNQRLAKLGSEDGSLSTIDLSNASDSITWTLLRSIAPQNVLRVLESVLPTHYIDPANRLHILQSAATMGNSMTFELESDVFLAIAKASKRIYENLIGPVGGPISVYGDDIIVPTEIADLLIELLTLLNFTVNRDKSFIDPEWKYRESCGEEYLEGINVSSLYFPRFPIQGKFGKFSPKAIRDSYKDVWVTTLTALVDLQHKLFSLCQPASILVAELIQEDTPRMTTSVPEENLSDLYSYESIGKTFFAPAGRFIPAKYDEKRPWRMVEPRKFERVSTEDHVRIGHLTPITKTYKVSHGLVDGASDEEQLLLDLYHYQEFLHHGPRYESELDRLLGITAPNSKSSDLGTGNIIWTYTK